MDKFHWLNTVAAGFRVSVCFPRFTVLKTKLASRGSRFDTAADRLMFKIQLINT